MAASLIIGTLVLAGCATAVDRRATAREVSAEAAYPPPGQFVTVDGIRLHAEVRGSGPDLVLIHGASGNTRDFSFALMDRLAPHYRVIAFDRPGMGYSGALDGREISPLIQGDLLRRAALQLGAEKPLVLGHSYGGAVALGWALTAPEPPAGLVLLSAATMPWPGGLGAWYAVSGSRLGAATVLPLVTAFAPPSVVQAAVTGIFAPDPVPPGYTEFVGAPLTLRRESLRVNAAQITRLRPHVVEMAKNYPRLSLPVELVHGDADTVVPLHIHSRPLAELLPDARLTVIPGGGHMPHHAQPDQVIAAIHRAAVRAGLR
ncbi:MAG: alpha/beta hydrolase [Gemmobacter sp.]|nr:alpha/beta hydrolase [Gemmobacter sp.]